MLPWDAKPELVCEELQPLLSILYKAFEEAIQRALRFFTELDTEIDTSTFACLVRYGVKVALNREGFAATNEEEVSEELQAAASDYDVRTLPNNGLLLWFKGCQIRIRKGHGLKPPAPTSATQKHFYEQRKCLLDWCQLRLEFRDDETDDEESVKNARFRKISMNLLIVWDVTSKFQFLGLRLMRPSLARPGPPSAEWSVRIPHPAELIKGESFADRFMFDPELPLAAVSIPAAEGKK